MAIAGYECDDVHCNSTGTIAATTTIIINIIPLLFSAKYSGAILFTALHCRRFIDNLCKFDGRKDVSGERCPFEWYCANVFDLYVIKWQFELET